MNIILLGAPGAGKGTQATRISTRYNIPHIATGDIFRKNIQDQTELGDKVKQYLDGGLLVPNELTVSVVEDRIKQDDCKDGFLLDGFPRNQAQAQILDQKSRVDFVLNIAVDLDILQARLVGRRVCLSCGKSYHTTTYTQNNCTCGTTLIQREDDTPQTVQNRLKVYTEQTQPLIEYYAKLGKIREVDGMKSIDWVWDKIVLYIEAFKAWN